MNPPALRPMTMADYDGVIALMHQTPGVSVREADSRQAIQRYLLRNPELSFVAEDGAALVGCIMSGHDGRRGYLQHLLVVPGYRERGVASALIEACLTGLEAIGILKSHIDVLATNEAGQRFWTRRGWMLRTDLRRYSLVRSGGDNV